MKEREAELRPLLAKTLQEALQGDRLEELVMLFDFFRTSPALQEDYLKQLSSAIQIALKGQRTAVIEKRSVIE